MTDISSHLTQAEKHLREATEAIAHGTMNKEQWEAARKAVMLGRGALDQALGWLQENPVE
jgi:hypothetical protein